MFNDFGKLSLVTVRKNMGDSGPPEKFNKTENEEIGTVDQPKSDKSDEDIPQDTSNLINSSSSVGCLEILFTQTSGLFDGSW